MINIYQIYLSDAEIQKINEQGHDSVPAQRARLNVQFGGAENFKYSDMKYYKHVMSVDTDDLDDAFELTNLWNDNSKIKSISRASSSSVGDIFQDGDRWYMVDSFGFKKLFPFNADIESMQ